MDFDVGSYIFPSCRVPHLVDATVLALRASGAIVGKSAQVNADAADNAADNAAAAARNRRFWRKGNPFLALSPGQAAILHALWLSIHN